MYFELDAYLVAALLAAADDNGLTATAEATATVQIVDAVKSEPPPPGETPTTLRGSTLQLVVLDGGTIMTVVE